MLFDPIRPNMKLDISDHEKGENTPQRKHKKAQNPVVR